MTPTVPNTHSAHPSAHATSKIAFSWLLMLRWGAVACQAVLICTVGLLFDIDLPGLILAAIIGFEAASNAVFHVLQRKKTVIPEWLFAQVMFLDVLQLTFLLHYTGGPMNPFTFLYLVHVVLGAILMRPVFAWALALYTIACYAFFFFPGGNLDALAHRPTPICTDYTGLKLSGVELFLHLQGMWLAFSITTLFIVFFVGRIQQALREHEHTIAVLREEKHRTEKLASLATLAAGAAHEFSNPLSIIAVASGEMQHALRQEEGFDEVKEDVRLIREQVARCKEILFQMSADAGEHLGETLVAMTVGELLDAVRASFPEAVWRMVDVTVEEPLRGRVINIPKRTLARTVKGFVKNAFDASEPSGGLVALRVREEKDILVIEVEDRGAGMKAEVLARATEPFFTTKEQGKGLGLGLFLAKSLAERLNGELRIESEPGRGTRVALRLPLHSITLSE